MNGMRIGAGALLVAALAGCGHDEPTAQRSTGLEAATAAGMDVQGHAGEHQVAVLDDCDPTDPAWAPTGGCALRQGSVTNAEFGAFLASALSQSVIGHPAWRNEPSYLEVASGKTVKVTNLGGRLHTFTRVATFGGGRVPPLNIGLAPAPECALAAGAIDPTAIAPGDRLELSGLSVGLHRYMCCIHPWMRAAIRVGAHGH
jgi:plastocyanin